MEKDQSKRVDWANIRVRTLDTYGGRLAITLTDGRVISVPLEWFPRLANATHNQRDMWRRSPDGTGFYWPDLDEDISVRVLMGHPS